MLKVILAILLVIFLLSAVFGTFYLVALGVTYLMQLGAGYFTGDAKLFFEIWFGICTLSLFFNRGQSKENLIEKYIK